MKYQFNGQWEFDYRFDAFLGLQTRRGSYTGKSSDHKSDGSVFVTIKDQEDDRMEPLPEQIATLNYIKNHPEYIRKALLSALHDFSIEIQKVHFNNEDHEDSRSYFPVLKSLAEYENTFGVGNLFIFMHNKNGFSYYGLECGSNSDEEHGLGFVLRLDKVIKIGQAEISFSEYSAFADLGIEESNYPPIIKTKIYPAHPKFSTFKPSHLLANEEYGHRLIIDDNYPNFVHLIEEQGHSIDYVAERYSWRAYTYLITSIRRNRKRFFDYLLGKGANLQGSLEIAAKTMENDLHYLKAIVAAGQDVNEKNKFGDSIIVQKLQMYLNTFSKCYNDTLVDQYMEQQRQIVARRKSQNLKVDEGRVLKNPREILQRVAAEIQVIKELGGHLDAKEMEKELLKYKRHADYDLIENESRKFLDQ